MKRRSWIAVPVLLIATLFVTAASAYYTDIKESSVTVKAAYTGFSGDGGGITVDSSDQDDRFVPIGENESFIIKCSAVYGGDVEALAVARLKLFIGNFMEGDRIKVSDGETEAVLEASEGEIFSAPIKLSPGDILEKTYTVTVESHASEEPLIFDHEFTVASTQYSGNEELIPGEKDPDEIYEDIEKGETEGFGEVSDPEGNRDPEGETGTVKRTAVKFIPEITDGFTDKNIFRWYAFYDDTSEKEISNRENLDLILNKSNIRDGLFLRFEVENEAGAVSSKVYRILFTEDGISVEEAGETAESEGIS